MIDELDELDELDAFEVVDVPGGIDEFEDLDAFETEAESGTSGDFELDSAEPFDGEIEFEDDTEFDEQFDVDEDFSFFAEADNADPGAADEAEDPLPYDDGPVRASPPIQHDPHPEPAIVEMAPVEDREPIQSIADDRAARSRRLLAALGIAIVVGGSLGVGGALLLTRLVDGGESAPATSAATGASSDEIVETAAATDQAGAAPTTALRLASLRFDDVGDTIGVASTPADELLAAMIAQDPTKPVVATVRTFTEATAADDLAMSNRQAEALTAHLVGLGADPSKIAVTGLGRSLLTSAQPVPNFVVPTTSLGRSNLGDVTASVGPFAIGIDEATGQLRPESLAALDTLAEAMAADPDGRPLTLAAYSFDQRDRSANEARAELAAATANAYLAEAGIDPSRLTTIVAGDEPFAVPDRVATHIDLRWGDAAVVPLAVHALAIDQVDFDVNSTELSQQAQTSIDQLGALLVASGADVVIDVHSFDGDEVQARVDLSVLRAQTIGQRLLGAGVPAQRIRLHGGTSAQFRAEDRVSRIVLTLLQPPDRS